ncbi:type IV toxin-antitoxin system AbiEi family antitoxin domain-containing protein [Microlunatus flavus]|uniref:Transcriptional regulator, AbiEi antitoxin, Type IV TA system n=1 Tax=Microlunatus flavus TaxID=1036181 RepID=A0A1H9FJS2_9ACTN|nr:type IV toxin-antitoxin system AbiEi family antitoxin domain-containing protein [Microlunatus flavus]SEQ38157.1 Transcriptional regulator, AbiEi antitoxin, Type IV TA system [Microlunatus flavus]
MHARQEPGPRLLRLATAQSDVVTSAQALGLGLSRHALGRLVDQERWQRLAPGLYVTHNAAVGWEALAWGGVLLGGPAARLGPTASAHAHGLLDDEPEPLDVLVPHGSPARSRLRWRFVHERPGARDPRCTGSPPRLLVPETVLDLCEGATARQVEDWVTKSVQRRLTTPQHLERALGRRSRHSRRTLLAELLVDVAEGAESPLELRYLRDVERRHGLPRGRRQRRTATPGIRDVLYRDFGVVVELDGKLGHEGVGRFRDMSRDNAALMEQLLTLRYGFGDVAGRSCAVAAEVAQLLAWRGWPGPFAPCATCQPSSR